MADKDQIWDKYPRKVGKYHLLGPLAQGGMGELFLAQLGESRDFQKLCVIKRMLPQLAHYTKYFNDTNVLVNGVVSGLIQAEPALETHQRLQQKAFDAKQRRWDRVAESRREEWKEIDARFLSGEW